MFIPLVAAKAGTQITNPEQAFLESRLRGNERLGLVHASRSLSLICGAAFVFAIAIPGAHSDASAEDATVTVFAAASLKNALDDVDQAFTRKSGVRVVASYAASSALIKQIENGAPADVFVSADLDWMDYGARHKLIKQDTRVDLLGNQLDALFADVPTIISQVRAGRLKPLAATAQERSEIFPDGKREDRGDRPRFRSRAPCRRWPHRDRRCARGADRQIRQGCARETRALGERRTQARDDRERARGAHAGRARRSGARHRLCDRRRGGAKREGRRHVSRRFASTDRLSGGIDGGRQAAGRAVSRVPPLGRSPRGVSTIRIHIPGEGGIVRICLVSLPAKAGNPVSTESWARDRHETSAVILDAPLSRSMTAE